MSFTLHPRLMADTVVIADWALSRVLLMNDARFPWIILVPRKEGLTEIFDLDEASQGMLTKETARTGARLKAWARKFGGGDKINIGMIGNLVPQLHVHVVSRAKSDPAWPGPVWGVGTAVPYEAGDLARTVADLRAVL